MKRNFIEPIGKFYGFEQYEFVVDGCRSIVVKPKHCLPEKPWIWRAEFFGAFPGIDIVLLQKGFFLAYIEVGNTFGCPDALRHWDVFYREMTSIYDLSPRPVLEGLSRGGLYIYNWAVNNTDKVGCLFGDAPVCDFKSWPGGKGTGKGSAPDWEKLLHDYGFPSEQEALDYRGNPIDNLKPLADAGIPIIHIYGDIDEIVPWKENTLVIKNRYQSLGGNIKIVVKPGIGHHPHGLENHEPIVEFIMESLSLSDKQDNR